MGRFLISGWAMCFPLQTLAQITLCSSTNDFFFLELHSLWNVEVAQVYRSTDQMLIFHTNHILTQELLCSSHVELFTLCQAPSHSLPQLIIWSLFPWKTLMMLPTSLIFLTWQTPKGNKPTDFLTSKPISELNHQHFVGTTQQFYVCGFQTLTPGCFSP